jgi:hypothetical protein
MAQSHADDNSQPNMPNRSNRPNFGHMKGVDALLSAVRPGGPVTTDGVVCRIVRSPHSDADHRINASTSKNTECRKLLNMDSPR